VKDGHEKKTERGDKKLGKRIRELREKKYPSQEDFSIATECSTSYISKLENGKASPSFEILKKIGKALDVPVKVLVDIDNDEGLTHKEK